MSAIGKTVARIEASPTDVEFGYQRDDTLLIHFTDGTALKVTGRSHEEVDLDYQTVDSLALVGYAHATQGRRERERLRRLQSEEWASITDDERAARTEARRAKMGPFARMMEDHVNNEFELIRQDINRTAYGPAE